VEHDSVIGVIGGNCVSISERVSGSGRKQLYDLHLTPQAYHSSFAADVLESDTAWIRLMQGPKVMSRLVRIQPGAMRCAIPVELVNVKTNSQVMVANSCPQSSS